MLRRLCGTFGRLPRSCLINEDFKTQEEIPFATRGYTDLWKRDWNGRKVAVKALRFAPDDDRNKTTKVIVFLVGRSPEIPWGTHICLQRFCKEVPLWKHVNHENILTFYGASMNQNRFCMVYPWMENGNILNYTRKNPEANRLRLVSGDEQWSDGESDSYWLAADRCSEWSQVPSPDEFGTREHSRGMSCYHDCLSWCLIEDLCSQIFL